ncbi:hypothetical protein PMAYCL1PPCAC_11794 [Pristionchus mayeri]|uniref:rRNA methyltransferase 2, mitochondrial n=1 Tax=Pristionchus mayeri TaxID=1317129 RepID=A0AAN5CFS1_9BILA|nr:hypothetical protein PMAYCL1PPCAC_11794 [Pristionchus mayeri]
MTTSVMQLFSISKRLASKSARTTAKYLKRQTEDPYCAAAREHNYRARSAFKLREIDDKHKLIRPGSTVVDVGAAPGSWSQVAVERSEGGRVVGVDLQAMLPLQGATLLSLMDIREKKTHEAMRGALEGRSVDVLLSDMAPSPTGDKATDHIRLISLCRMVLQLTQMEDSPIPLSADAVYLCKIWDGVERKEFMDELKRVFSSVRMVKPVASRDSSAEMYLLSRNPIVVKK